MASADDETRDKAMHRYGNLEAEFTARGGYAAESEAASIASSLALDERILGQPLETLSGGQRRRVELSRILFSGAQTLLLDEPTNHLDADSIVWLRDYLKAYKGGLIIISHDVEMLDTVVNRVFHLDANRAEMDIYNIGWKPYLLQRETDERRRKRERAQRREEGGHAAGPGRQDARQGHQGRRGPEHGQARRAAAGGHRGRAGQRQGRQAALPRPRPVRQDAADRARACPAPTARWRSSPTSTSPSTAAPASWSSASTARARPPCCASCPGSTPPTPARWCPGTG